MACHFSTLPLGKSGEGAAFHSKSEDRGCLWGEEVSPRQLDLCPLEACVCVRERRLVSDTCLSIHRHEAGRAEQRPLPTERS